MSLPALCPHPLHRRTGYSEPGVYDGVLYWICEDCGEAVPRFSPGSRMRAISERHVAMVNSPRRERIRIRPARDDDQ